MSNKPAISVNKIRGMLMGAFQGDALGAPHESRKSKLVYTGLLEHKLIMRSQYQGTRELPPGSLTDDSESTLALLRTLIADHGYNREHVLQSYLKWANSGCWFMGKNTRALFHGVTTIRGYNSRVAKITSSSQSNGAMMRCSPLALLWDNSSVIEDCNLSNSNNVCRDCNLVYVAALRLALTGTDGNTIFSVVKTIAQTDEVKFVLDQVEKREHRDITENRGWCLHALWCSMIVITSFTNYSEAMNWVITSQPGSDTDTNGCIAGALLGAILGFEIMRSESLTSRNIEIMLNVNSARPAEYTLQDFYQLTELAATL